MEIKNEKKPLTKKQKAAFERRRRRGYAKYIKEKRREITKRKRKEAKEKEKAKKRKLKEKLKLKNKRPVGRPKKRGPKKKRKNKVEVILKSPGRHTLPPFNYKIISCRNGVQNKFIGKYRTIEEVYEVFNELKANDKNIIFPSIITGDDRIKNSIDEYIIIEKTDTKPNLLRNKYGKLVEHSINRDGWIIIDKFRYKREETFWVYGYNNKNDRKTFLWIYVNLISSELNEFNFKRIFLYKNKLLIKDDAENIEMVICKDISDAIRLYNKIEEWTKIDKLKQVLFIGDFSEIGDRRRKLEDELMKLTGWGKKKIQMKTTTYYQK
jgi:hypothetical protein